MKSIRIQLQRIKTWLVMLLLAGSMTGFAQSEYFEYEDEGKTIITGLMSTGQAATSLTIPKEVTTVKSEAFYYSSAEELMLIIEAGGNPAFEPNLFGFSNTEVSPGVYEPNPNRVIDIQILGNSMSVANITALLTSLVAKGALSTVYIEGYSGAWSNIGITDVLTEKVEVRLPAALVTTQQFGAATVFGRFTIDKEIITFCTSATFRDTDQGSNMLFYRADSIADDGRLHIQRVDYVVAGEGVLIHRTANSQGYCDLERSSGDVSYSSNMLVGVTSPTLIESTDGTKTNYILKDGAFHPTTGGTVKANKAYLQIPTSAAREMLTISFDDEETTGVAEVRSQIEDVRGDVYDLSGRRVAHPTKGLYITNGKKYVIR